MNKSANTNRRYLNLIKVVSLLIPVIVFTLLFIPEKLSAGTWVYTLPHLNAIINSTTSLILISAFISILGKNIKAHRGFMMTAFGMGVIFLISYVTYHSTADSTLFGDINFDGELDDIERQAVEDTRSLYLFFLLSHILCSIAVVPLVLIAFYFSLTGQIPRHKKIVRFAFPVWLYVSITGVIVYFMIRPYYQY